MAVVREFTLPDLGEGLTGAEIVRWLVEVGEVVAVDQPVVEVETAKAMVDVPCPYAGVVTARFGEEGTELPVGAPLLTVASSGVSGGPGAGGGSAEAGGSGNGRVAHRPEGPASSSGPPSGGPISGGRGAVGGSAAEGSGNVLVGYGTAAPAERRRRVRPADGGAVPTTAEGPVPVISPLVRRLARQHGIDLRQLVGSGPEGLILRADVERAIPGTAQTPDKEPGEHREPGERAEHREHAEHGERIPLRGVRGAVADKLARSHREIPDATCWVDADATELLAARTAMNATGGPKISVLALLARICTAALARFPDLNARVDMERREVVRLGAVHLGFAAQTDRGLVVPVVRDAHTLSVEGLAAEMARLTEAAREGALAPADLTGGTFTLNNYGVFGVDGSTPIINHPEAAMLGVGRIAAKPWVHQGELAVRHVVQLSFTFDHRVCDGGTAGGFLRYVADCVEQPSVLLRVL